MKSGITLEKPLRRTGSFASRMLNKELEERGKKTSPSIEFVKPNLGAVEENPDAEKKASDKESEV